MSNRIACRKTCHCATDGCPACVQAGRDVGSIPGWIAARAIEYQIFVSSTYENLKDERSEVIKACLNMGHIPVGMEMFNAADEQLWQVITRACISPI
jgi:hypothetical protein